MPNGKQGDHPITDLLIHGLHPFPADIEAMLREVLALDRNFPDGRRRYADQVEWERMFFAWERGERLAEGRQALRQLLDELRQQRSDLVPFVAHYVARLTGAEAADAVLSLTERPETLPLLEEEYRRESDPGRRQVLLHCIWQFRDSAALATLAAGLDDADERVWKEALDGLVSIGGRGAASILQRAQSSTPATPHAERTRWIDEAIRQLQEPQ